MHGRYVSQVRHPPVPAKDLAPPAACSSSVHQLIELLESPDFSMVDTETRDEFQPILDAIIDPLVVRSGSIVYLMHLQILRCFFCSTIVISWLYFESRMG